MSRRDACLPASVTRLAGTLAVCVPPLALAWFIVALAAGLPGLRCAPAGWCASAQSNDAFDEALEKAQLNLRRRNYDEALKWFKRANGMKANNCAECLWGMAQAYSRLGAQKTVLETCDRLVQAAADDPALVAKAYNLKGITLSNLAMEKPEKRDSKKLAEAEAAFRKVLEADPEFGLARFNLGVTLIRLNREAEGLQELKAFVENSDEGSDAAKEAQKMIENPRRARENYAPDFSISTPEGEYISSDDLRGKVVLLDFWGTWCPPCVESVPSLVHLNKKFSKDPFMLISISSDEDAEVWRGFIAKHKMTWPQYLDRTDKVQHAFQVHSFPTYVLIDHEGVIRYHTSGYSMFVEGMIEDALKKALKSAAKRPPPQTAPAPQASASPKPSLAAPPMAPPAPMKTEASRAETLADQPETSENKANTSRLPPPVLEVLAAEQMEVGSQRLNRYPLRIKNWMSLPDEMFEPVKDLPPCGMGASATRLEVVIWSAEGEKLLGYCDLPRAEILQRFWLFLSPGQRPPERIYITLKDRRSGYTIRSNIVALPTVKENSP